MMSEIEGQKRATLLTKLSKYGQTSGVLGFNTHYKIRSLVNVCCVYSDNPSISTIRLYKVSFEKILFWKEFQFLRKKYHVFLFVIETYNNDN